MPSRRVRGLDRQLSRTFQECRCGREPTACLSALGGAFEVGSDVLVRHDGCLGAVPGAPIRVGPGIGRLCERAMRVRSLLRSRGSIYRGANERMAEGHLGTEGDEAARLCGMRRSLLDAESPGSPPHERRVACRIARGDESRRRASRGRAATRRSKLSWIPAWPGAGPGTPKPPAIRDKAHIVRELHEGEWIAARLDDQPLEHLLVEGRPQDGLEERPGIAMTKWLDVHLGQAPQRPTHLPRAEQDGDPLGCEPASREPEDLCGRAIEPLGVIDQAEEAVLLRRLGEESENRESDEERVRCRPDTKSEGDLERLALRLGQTLAKRQDRRTELLDGGERELHLAVDAGSPDDPERPGPRHRVVEERGLADSRVAMDDERPAIPVTSGLHRSVDSRSLALPPQQLQLALTSTPRVGPACDLSMPLGSPTTESGTRWPGWRPDDAARDPAPERHAA